MDHASVLTDRNEGSGEAADIGGCHDAALFDLVVEQGEGCSGSGCASALKAHLAEDIRDTVADCGCGSQGQVDDAEGDAEPAGCLAGDELSDTGDLEGGLFDSLAEDFEVLSVDFFKGAFYDAGAADTDVEDAVCLCDAVEGTCHEGVVIGCVAEDDEFGAAEGIAVSGALGCPLDDAAHEADGIHVDAGLGGAHVDAGAHDIGLSQGIRYGLDQHAVGRGHSLGDQGGIAAQEIDADLFGRAVKGLGQQDKVITAAAGTAADDGNGRDRDALIYNRNPVFSCDLLTGPDQVAGACSNLVIYFCAKAAEIGIHTVQEADAHGDRADVEILAVDHGIGFGYFRKIDHNAPPKNLLIYHAGVLWCVGIQKSFHANENYEGSGGLCCPAAQMQV